MVEEGNKDNLDKKIRLIDEPGVERVMVRAIDGTELEQITTDHSRHYRRVSDNRYFVSITHLIDVGVPVDSFLLEWMKNEGRNADVIRDKAAEQGERVHKAIFDTLQGKELHMEMFDKKERRGILGYVNWLSEIDTRELWAETVVISEKYGYAATIDRAFFLAEDPNTIWIVDYKLTSSLQEKHKIQVVAQKLALRETLDRMNRFMDKQIIPSCLQLGTASQKRYLWAPVLPDMQQHYEELLELALGWYRHRHPQNMPDIEQHPETIKLEYKFYKEDETPVPVVAESVVVPEPVAVGTKARSGIIPMEKNEQNAKKPSLEPDTKGGRRGSK